MWSFILLLKFKNRKIYERVGSWSPAFPCFIKLSHAWWCGTLQIALREVIITEVSLHFSTVLLDWTDLKENLMKQLSVKWLYSVVDVLLTVFIPLRAFLFPVSPLIYQCNYCAAKKFCWRSLFLPLSTAFSFSNCFFFYIPWLPINSSKKKKFVWKPEFISGFTAHMVYFRRSRTLIFYRKLPGNWGVVARKSPRSEWVNSR